DSKLIPAPGGRGSKGEGVKFEHLGNVPLEIPQTKAAFTLAEGATHVNKPPIFAKSAFTLAEILITLGIIGVVAAMTIPNLMTSYKAHKLRAQFLKSYSIIQQISRQMKADDIEIETLQPQGKPVYTTFINYMSGARNCGSGPVTKCFSLYDYYDYSYSKIGAAGLDDGMIIASDGTVYMFENMYTSSTDVWITVDINGYRTKPNTLGYDVFTFQYVDGEFKPMGAPGTTHEQSLPCKTYGANKSSYVTCSYAALNDPNYFKLAVKKLK
ncbi:MAG: type II secretion system GspH family protein, partial [Muribaculaceae bacterium]|nr:type II secretion system GspH family protein [Muribaculaceae bacterium]